MYVSHRDGSRQEKDTEYGVRSIPRVLCVREFRQRKSPSYGGDTFAKRMQRFIIVGIQVEGGRGISWNVESVYVRLFSFRFPKNSSERGKATTEYGARIRVSWL